MATQKPKAQAKAKIIKGLKNYQHEDHFGQWLGYSIHKLNYPKGIAEAKLKLREDHLSPAGRVHGGVISGFFDYTCGAAVFLTLKPKDFCSTVELKVNYLKPLNVGDQLLARVEVVFRGKRLCVVRGLAYRTNRRSKKEAVAMASATFNIVSE